MNKMSIGVRNMYMMMLCKRYGYTKKKRQDICRVWIKQITGESDAPYTPTV